MSEIKQIILKSEHDNHRYQLRKLWGKDNGDWSKMLPIILLNPPSKEPIKDNPTTRRCISIAKDAGYTGLLMANLFSYCTPDQEELYEGLKFYDHSENNKSLHQIAYFNENVVVAWGHQTRAKERVDYVIDNIFIKYAKENRRKIRFLCLGLTKKGFPRHPLFVPSGTKLEEWTNES